MKVIFEVGIAFAYVYIEGWHMGSEITLNVLLNIEESINSPDVIGRISMSKVNEKPFGSFAFRVKVDGKEMGLFQEVSGLGAQINVQDLVEGGLNTTTLKLSGNASYPNLSLKRGFCVSTMMDWFESYRRGVGATRRRLSGTIEMLGDDGNPVMTWAFVNGIPLKWDGPQLSVSQNAIAIESLEIAHEGLEKI